MEKIEDLTGWDGAGKWTILEKLGALPDKSNRACYYLCRCICGKEVKVRSESLKNGRSTSCGCVRKTAGGASYNEKKVEYNTWRGMISRCHNKNHTHYEFYGAKGIVVCDEWRNSFEKFYEDMGPRPSSKYSLDRYPKSDGNYQPDNTRWATAKEQALNKNKTLYLTYKGETKAVKEWADITGISYSVIRHRLHKQWPMEEIFETKSKKTSKSKTDKLLEKIATLPLIY